MEPKLYSEQLQPFVEQIENPVLKDSLSALSHILNVEKLNLLQWDENSFAVALTIQVEIPPLGTYNDIDIRREEPILIVFSLKSYPFIPPKVYPDRLDFPKDKIAHLYVAKKGKPPGLCLVRGEFKEWYADKRIEDLLVRITNWFRDAATGSLITDGDQFEPLRLEGYSGVIIYDYGTFKDVANTKTSDWGKFAWCLFERMDEVDSLGLRLYKVLNKSNYDAVYKEVAEEREKDSKLITTKKFYFGFIFWAADEKEYSDYDVNLPDDWESFKEFCVKYGIDVVELEKNIVEYDKNQFILFPVIIAIKRPMKIIGFDGQFEFINFLFKLDSTDVSDGKIINNIPISFQKHLQPLTREKARSISGITAIENDRMKFIFGCGALGSKIATHLARNGIAKLVLIDPEKLSPHNLVRHSLFSDQEGKNKAVALEASLNQIFPADKETATSFPFPNLLMKMLPEFPFPGWLFDFTASESFHNEVVKLKFKSNFGVVQSFISDKGNLGVLFIEGENRNPRVDDLQNMLYLSAVQNSAIAEWLNRELNIENKPELVMIGVGCNSETTIIPDELISMHAAYFASIIKKQIISPSKSQGVIYASQFNPESNDLSTKFTTVYPFTIISPVNDNTWEIRFESKITERMNAMMLKAYPSETGGVFIGACNYKTKTIHVVDMIEAPPDSKANPVCFFRGVFGLKDKIEIINKRTGYQLGYIGEWHSHPLGPEGLSATDLETVRRFKEEFSRLIPPLPVLLTIITKKNILPFIFKKND